VPRPTTPTAPPDARARARPGPRPGRGESTRRRLLAAAESVFAELGYHEASIVRITEQAGVAQGTFYLYFGSKQQIFEEVVADLNHRVRQAMTSASDGAPSRMEAERRGFAAFFRFTAEHPALYRVIRQAEFVSPAAMRGHYERIIAGYVTRLEAGMADGEVAAMDPAVLAWALIAVGEMTGMRWILWDDARAMPPAVFDQVMTVVGRMLGGPPPGLGASTTDATTTDPGHDTITTDTGRSSR
jgi:AcrR family transcriptional regulator